jgi:hypothetical protein
VRWDRDHGLLGLYDVFLLRPPPKLSKVSRRLPSGLAKVCALCIRARTRRAHSNRTAESINRGTPECGCGSVGGAFWVPARCAPLEQTLKRSLWLGVWVLQRCLAARSGWKPHRRPPHAGAYVEVLSWNPESDNLPYLDEHRFTEMRPPPQVDPCLCNGTTAVARRRLLRLL